MKNWVKHYRTSLGGIILLAAVAALIFHKIDTEQAMAIMATAGAWVGLNAADTNK